MQSPITPKTKPNFSHGNSINFTKKILEEFHAPKGNNTTERIIIIEVSFSDDLIKFCTRFSFCLKFLIEFLISSSLEKYSDSLEVNDDKYLSTRSIKSSMLK